MIHHRRNTSLFVLVLGSAACSSRCPAAHDYPEVQVGIGVRDFISVPVGLQVSPDTNSDEPFFYVALRGWGLEQSGLTVELQAFVGGERFARNEFEDVEMRCRSGLREVAGLQLFLDPSDLPRPPSAPPVDTGSYRVDTGFLGVDTGYSRVDTGYFASDWRADVRIEATVSGPSGRVASGQTLWFVYR